jgi:putative phage-type endonuclease
MTRHDPHILKIDGVCIPVESYSMMLGPMSEFLETLDNETPCPTASSDWIEDVVEFGKSAGVDAEVLEVGCEILQLFLAQDNAAINERRKCVEDLALRKQQAQRTKEWYDEVANMLTASEFADILGTELGRARMIMKKALPPPQMSRRLACPTAEMNAFDWGTRYEPVAKQILEREWGATIGESGRLYHPTMTRLAASPDGFIVDAKDKTHVGRLLEIKCPISRKIEGKIPHKYWVQMQIQMEVAGIHECDYVEVSLESPVKEGEQVDGTLWLLKKNDEYVYAYTESEREVAVSDGWSLEETVTWRKKELSHHVVPVDHEWFKSTLEKQEAFWRDVEAAKRGEFKMPESTRVKKCLIVD